MPRPLRPSARPGKGSVPEDGVPPIAIMSHPPLRHSNLTLEGAGSRSVLWPSTTHTHGWLEFKRKGL